MLDESVVVEALGSVLLISLVLLAAQLVQSRNVETGKAMFPYRIARVASCLALLGVSMYTRALWSTTCQTVQCVAYGYASLLAAIVILRKGWAQIAGRHLSAILFVLWVTQVYRNVWPLATFTFVPADSSEGGILWAKVLVLTFATAVLPLVSPRTYVPANSKRPWNPAPEQTASIASMAVYSWLNKLGIEASKSPHLSTDKLPELADYDDAELLMQKSSKTLDPLQNPSKRHMFWRLIGHFRVEYSIMATMMTFQAIARFVGPLGINQILHYLETDGEGAVIRPWVWVAFLILGPTLATVSIEWYTFVGTRMLVRTTAILTQLILEHSLRIRIKADVSEPHNKVEVASQPAEGSDAPEFENNDDSRKASASRTTSTSYFIGRINNLVTSDVENIMRGRDFLFIILQVPLQLLFCAYFLYLNLGWSALLGMTITILLFPLPGYVASMSEGIQKEKMRRTDARVHDASEVLSVVRMVKMFGWETRMIGQLSEKRKEELKLQWRYKLLELINGNINQVLPFITVIITFSAYTLLMHQSLTASTVFSSLAVLDILRYSLHQIFYMVPAFVRAKVSLDRVNDFLLNTELLDEFSDDAKSVAIPSSIVKDDVIAIRNTAFTWGGRSDAVEDQFILRIDGEICFKRGQLNLVIGPTGSGKTSLLMALLGEMHHIGTGPDSFYYLPRSGGVAYATQESWVQNDTIRENILFGAPFDEERYKIVIDQCGLKRDLLLFEAGDMTEVGEKGLTLSGGQKARITLARAVYSSAEVLLLDDVLAALDVHTVQWIVDKCFKGDLLRGRTVLLITHNIAIVKNIAEFVVTLGPDGHATAHRTLSDVLAEDPQLVTKVEEEELVIEKSEEEIDSEPTDIKPTAGGKLTVAEEISLGRTSRSAMKLFFSSLAVVHPIFFWTMCVGALVLSELADTLQTWLLGYWAQQYKDNSPSEVKASFYLALYGLVIMVCIIFHCISFMIYFRGSMRASKSIHDRLVASVLQATLRWLDVTPVSRIIARCTQDIDAVDGPVTEGFRTLMGIAGSMTIKLTAVVVLSPIFLIFGALITAVGVWCGNLYIAAQLSVKREMSNARAPIIGHVGAAIAGLTSLRAYGAQDMFRRILHTHLNRWTRTARTFYNLNRWICVRIDTLGALFTTALAIYLVYGRSFTASDSGFSLNMASAFSGMILWLVRCMNDFEVAANSLERIEQYLEIEHEPSPTENGLPPAYWPATGDLRVEKLSARYSPDGPRVLHDISFNIKSGERVGIVGRTGSGKSSLTLSLLRCVLTEGKVYYDGIATDMLNLDALRSNITIIPQVPELLSGTLRQNLDPFGQCDDAELNDALRTAGLFSLISETNNARITLDTQLTSGGNNLSVGQQQILALARAIVRKSKLLILDEATSAIDYTTDSIIQYSLRKELAKDVTVLTIAHRLQTIMDADHILVLDAGRIAEYGTPSELLENKNGMFKALVDESSDRDALYAIAKSSAPK